jgi:FkbM family methyltransferase
MTALSAGELRAALVRLGSDGACRQRVIDLLVSLEPALMREGVNVREEITGPVVDALHAEGMRVERTLESGVTLSFPYRSKIARDFVMASGERPDHAWEPQTTKLLLWLARDVAAVLVGGAYFGDHAIPLAHQLRGRGAVHCFDLNGEQIAILRENAARNGLDNVIINQLALWDTGDRRLVLEGDDSHAFAREARPEELARAFSTTSIDAYAAQKKIDELDVIMLDIEGGELAALRGAAGFLARPAPQAPSVVFEVHRAYVDWSQGLEQTPIVRLLTGHGYQVFAVRDYQGNVDMRGQPIELIPVDRVYLQGPPHGFNMLAIKREEIVSGPGFRVVRDVSPKLLFHRDPKLHQPLP